MKTSKKKKINIKEWLTIARIKLVDFIKEHKYVSIGIGVFLLSLIIFFAVRAAGDGENIHEATVSDVHLSAKTAKQDSNTEAPNFTDVNYTISYYLGAASGDTCDNTKPLDVLKFQLELKGPELNEQELNDPELNKLKSVKWHINSEDDTVSADNKTLTAYEYNVDMCKPHSTTFTLSVGNAVKNTEIKLTSVKIKPGNDAELTPINESLLPASIRTTHSNTISNASVRLVSGAAPKKGGANSRYTYFGLVAGVEASSLEDTYIENATIYLSVSETGEHVPKILTDAGTYGKYEDVANNNYFRTGTLPIISNSAAIASFEPNAFRETEELTPSNISSPSISVDEFENSTVDKIDINEEEYDSVKNITVDDNTLNVRVNPENGATVTLTAPVTGNLTDGYTLAGDISAPTVSMNNITTIGFGINNYVESTLKVGENTCGNITVDVNSDSSFQEMTCGNKTYYFKSSALSSSGTITYTIRKNNPADGSSSTSDFEVTLPKVVTREKTFYKLSLNLSDVNFSNLEKKGNLYEVGSYYISVETAIASTITLDAFNNSSDTPIQSISKTNTENYKGTNTLTNNLYVNEGGSYTKVEDNTSGYAATMGENVKLRTSFVYGVDADPELNTAEFTIDIDDKMTPIKYTEDSQAETSLDYLVSISSSSISIDSTSEAFNSSYTTTIKYCISNGTCYDSIGDNPSAITKLKVTLKVNNTPDKPDLRGAKIDIDTMYLVDTISDVSDPTTLTIGSTATVVAKDSEAQIDTLTAASNRAMLTPYKVRSIVLIGKDDEYNSSDISVDVSRNEIYTSKITTLVNSPAMEQQTSIFGYNRIQSVPVVITLPSGINYVYNDNYEVKPVSVTHNSDGTTTLKYNYTNVEPNTWLDDIYYDFNSSLDIENNLSKTITTVVGQSSNYNNIKYDVSGLTFRTISNEVRITNVKTIAYGQYSYKTDSSEFITSIDKEGSFDFETQLYNNHSDSLNATVYTILPNNNGVTKYHGTYTVSNIPTDAVCTTEVASEDKNSEDYVVNISEWSHDACSSSEISAYRMTYTLPATAQSPTKTRINISTKNNKAGDAASGEAPDVYEFRSVITYTDPTESEGHQNVVESFNKLNVGVTGKRITGTVWEDFNVDGIMDDDELRLDAVKLILHNKLNGSVVGEPVSPNSKGFYEFNGVSTGTYYITAEYNNDKYYSTVNITDYPDPSKISVFTSSSVEIQAEPESTSLGDDPECEDPEDCDSKCEDPEECDSSGSGTIDPDQDETEPIIVTTTVSPDIVVTDSTRHVQNINLGLALKRLFSVKLNKYITRAEVTNALGIVTRKEYGNVKLAKLDVKDMNNINIKVVYTIELQNIKYYPGYITAITETIPDGMSFNPEYEENKGWEKVDDATLMNYSLQNDLIGENEKRYLTVAFDIARKEAGSFVNTASVDKLSILGGVSDEE